MDNCTANESLPICSSTISEDYPEIPDQLPDNIRLPDVISDEEGQTIISLSDTSSIIEDVLDLDKSAETAADSQNVANKYSQQLCRRSLK